VDLIVITYLWLLSLAGYVMGGNHHGWLGERILFGENELAGFRNAQQVFLPLINTFAKRRSRERASVVGL
jgi:hypothetical protein